VSVYIGSFPTIALFLTITAGTWASNFVRFAYHISALFAGVYLASSAVAQNNILPVSVQLNAAAIQPERGFSGVIGAAFLPDGHIVVGDAGKSAIHRFDANGKYLGSVGRRGKGPGEFEDLNWLVSCSDGSVLAFDASLYRINVFDQRGVFKTSFVPPTWFQFDSVLSCDEPRTAVLLQKNPRAKPAQRGRSVIYPAAIVKIKWAEKGLDTLITLSGSEFFFAKVRGYVDLPLGQRAIAAASGGYIAAGVSNETALLFFRPNGKPADTLTINGLRKRTSAIDWQKAKIDRLKLLHEKGAYERVRQVLEEAEPPTTLPLFDAIFVDRFTASAWIRLFTNSQRAEWIRLNPSASGRKRFLLPENVEVIAVSAEKLLGLQRSEDGNEQLILFTFTR